jgi:glycerol-3-phosphate dehydrogenase
MNFSRPEQLQELESKSEFDLLIIGGGIVGSAALQKKFLSYQTNLVKQI